MLSAIDTGLSQGARLESLCTQLGISPRTLRYKLAQLRERGLMLNAA